MKNYILRKKTFIDIVDKSVNFLKKYNKVIFSIFGIALAVFSSIFFWCNSLVFLLSLAGACIVFILLGIGNIVINSTLVKIGWAGIMHSVFMIITNALQIDIPPVVYGFGSITAMFVCAFIYVYTPKISYLLKLNKHKKGYKNSSKDVTEYNGCLGIAVLYAIITIIVFVNDSNRKTNFDFAREEFIKITSWQIENYRGNTCYIVTCSKGRILISPYDYPEIRDITSDTKIKVLTEYSGYPRLKNVKKIEIKND